MTTRNTTALSQLFHKAAQTPLRSQMVAAQKAAPPILGDAYDAIMDIPGTTKAVTRNLTSRAGVNKTINMLPSYILSKAVPNANPLRGLTDDVYMSARTLGAHQRLATDWNSFRRGPSWPKAPETPVEQKQQERSPTPNPPLPQPPAGPGGYLRRLPPKQAAADVSDFRLAFPEAAGREADFVEGFLKRAHEICGHSIEGTPDLPQALLSIAIAEKLASTPDFLAGFTKQLEVAGAPVA